MSNIDIINQIINSAKRYNLPASILVAQAILETGWFKRMPYFNMFGIKASKTDIEQGKFFTTQTKEVVNGQTITIVSKFAKFNNIDEAVKRYNDIIIRNFPNADKNRSNSLLFLNGLFSGKYKYATDPKYIDKIKKIIESLKKKALPTSRRALSIGGGTVLLFLTFLYFASKKKIHKFAA